MLFLLLLCFLFAMPRKQGHGSSAKRSKRADTERKSAQRQSQSGQGEDVDEEMPASSSAPASAPASGPIAARPVLFGAPDDLSHALFSGECGLPILTLPAFYCSPIHPLLLSALRAYSYLLLHQSIHPYKLHQSIHSFFLPSANMAGSRARADRRGGCGRGYARIIIIIGIIIVIVIGISTGVSLSTEPCTEPCRRAAAAAC